MDSTDTAISFFTFLTVLANLATAGVAGVAAARFVSPRARAAWSGTVRPQLVDGGVVVAWMVAVVCMSGSLWFSEVAGFLPCRLCWVQRACMYPLVVILGVAALARWRWARPLAIGLAAVGASVAVYHVLLERYPSLESGTCDPDNPCSLVWFRELGLVTLPYMALSGFALILTLLVASRSPFKESPT